MVVETGWPLAGLCAGVAMRGALGWSVWRLARLSMLWGGLLFSSWSWASGELHLSFHMVIAYSGQTYVGGTLVNRGDAPVSHGFVVVTLIDAQCRPQESVLGNFAEIPAGETREFRVPLQWKYQRYQVTALSAFDREGVELVAIDDNAALLQLREADEQAKCAQLREATSVPS